MEPDPPRKTFTVTVQKEPNQKLKLEQPPAFRLRISTILSVLHFGPGCSTITIRFILHRWKPYILACAFWSWIYQNLSGIGPAARNAFLALLFKNVPPVSEPPRPSVSMFDFNTIHCKGTEVLANFSLDLVHVLFRALCYIWIGSGPQSQFFPSEVSESFPTAGRRTELTYLGSSFWTF